MKNILTSLSMTAIASMGLATASVADAQRSNPCRDFCFEQFGPGGPNEDAELLYSCVQQCRGQGQSMTAVATPRLDAKRD